MVAVVEVEEEKLHEQEQEKGGFMVDKKTKEVHGAHE